ncbi:MAG TPA: ATP-binding cassette domain-containing protein [Aestuariivirgaceae bacterium]|nr:ATP-binding cassette domain-containing protein [Aestuariivirgaceae bacterium]
MRALINPVEAGATGLALRLRNVSFAYGHRQALDGISFDVMAGRVTMLLGPNGAGKTTLFSLICRLLPLSTGEIEIAGRPVGAGPDVLRSLSIVFQQPTIDPDMTVAQNLLYYGSLRGLSGRESQARLGEELARLDMGERAGDKVRNLNGGHRRRVEIARALMDRPRVMLLDEPTVGLDVPTRRALVRYLHELAERRGMAVLWGTHLIDEVAAEDDIVILSLGRVAAAGKRQEIVAATGGADLDEAFRLLTRSGAEALR